MKLQKLRPFLRRVQIAMVLLLLQTTFSKSEEENKDDFDEELYSVIDSVRDGSLWTKSRHVRSIDLNRTDDKVSFSDNSLWNDLWFECRKKASFSCVRTGVFKYLDKSLERNSELSLTDSLFFRRNNNKVNGFCENSEDERETCSRYNEEKLKAMENEGKENEINSDEGDSAKSQEYKVDSESQLKNSTSENEEEEDITEGAADGRSVDSLGELSDILYDKGTHFLMTHDMEFQLPELFFGGGSVKIEPKSYIVGSEDEEEGTLVKVVFKPPPPPAHVIRGRVFHHLKKLFKKKLMHSFMALMLIIKMIKIKVMFLLPMIIGKATAKKLLLKVLLFLIPGLAHLFKLCHYYHTEHAKYHHHHHKIKHHHHHIQVPVPVPVPVHHHPEPNIHVEPNLHHVYEKPYGPSGGSYDHDYPPYPSNHIHAAAEHDYDYPSSNGGQGQGYGHKDYGSYGQYSDNEAHLASWGLGSSNYHEAGVLDAKNQPLYVRTEIQNFMWAPLRLQILLTHWYKNHPYAGYYQNHDQSGLHSQRYVTKLQLLTPKPPPGITTVPVAYDPFYSPILQKIDKIFAQLGFNEEACRERLICSMYKSPQRFSPHSNLLSNELSRDSSDLQKPLVSNSAVLRFYRYIQAARDGQDQKDCLRLYSACTVNTER